MARQSINSLVCGPGYSRGEWQLPSPSVSLYPHQLRRGITLRFFPTLCNNAIRLKNIQERSGKVYKTYVSVSMYRIPYRTYDVKVSDFVREFYTVPKKAKTSTLPPLFKYAYGLFTLPNNCQWHVRKCTYYTVYRFDKLPWFLVQANFFKTHKSSGVMLGCTSLVQLTNIGPLSKEAI